MRLRNFKYKLRPGKRFKESCETTLEACRTLYNSALEQRISRFKQTGKSMSFVEQSRQLTEVRRELTEHSEILRSFQTNTLKKLDLAYRGFFRRVKKGEVKVGFPRFKGFYRFDSFKTEDAREFRIESDKLIVQKLGSCRVRLSRPLGGRPKAMTIKRECDGWYVIICCECEELEPLPKTGEKLGIDVGLESFATLWTGERIENPRYFKKAENKLAESQRRLSLKKKGSESRKRAKRVVARHHAKIKGQRDWFQWNEAKNLVREFDSIAVEDLKIKGMIQGRLSKSIHDAGWSSFIDKLKCKAEDAGCRVDRSKSQTYIADLSLVWSEKEERVVRAMA